MLLFLINVEMSVSVPCWIIEIYIFKKEKSS